MTAPPAAGARRKRSTAGTGGRSRRRCQRWPRPYFPQQCRRPGRQPRQSAVSRPALGMAARNRRSAVPLQRRDALPPRCAVAVGRQCRRAVLRGRRRSRRHSPRARSDTQGDWRTDTLLPHIERATDSQLVFSCNEDIDTATEYGRHFALGELGEDCTLLGSERDYVYAFSLFRRRGQPSIRWPNWRCCGSSAISCCRS